MNLFSLLRHSLIVSIVWTGSLIPAWSIEPDELINLRMPDGTLISVQYKYIKQSVTLNNLLEDFQSSSQVPDEIPLHNVSTSVFRLIVQGLKALHDNKLETFAKWILPGLWLDELGRFIVAANYLGCEPLLEAAAKVFLGQMKNDIPDLVSLKSLLFTADFNKDVQDYIAALYYRTNPLFALSQTLKPEVHATKLNADGSTLAYVRRGEYKEGGGYDYFLTAYDFKDGKFVRVMDKLIGFPVLDFEMLAIDPTGRYVSLPTTEFETYILDLKGKQKFSNIAAPSPTGTIPEAVYLFGNGSLPVVAIDYFRRHSNETFISYKAIQKNKEDDEYFEFVPEQTIENSEEPIVRVFSHSGNNFVSYSTKAGLSFWQLVDGKWQKTSDLDLPQHVSRLESISFSPDDNEIRAADESGIYLWKGEKDQFKTFKHLAFPLPQSALPPLVWNIRSVVWLDHATIAIPARDESGLIFILTVENNELKIYFPINTNLKGIVRVFGEHAQGLALRPSAKGSLFSSAVTREGEGRHSKHKLQIMLWLIYIFHPSVAVEHPLLQVWLVDFLKRTDKATFKAGSLQAQVWETLDPVLKAILRDKVIIEM